MKPLFALFIAACAFVVVAAGAIWAWQTGSPRLLGDGRLDGAEPPGRFAVQAALEAARADLAAAQTAARVSRGQGRIAAQARVKEAGARVRRFRSDLAR